MKYKPDFLVTPYQLVEDQNIKPLDERVYSVVYYFSKMRGEKCTASNDTLATICKSTPKSVQKSLLNLEKHGYIMRTYKDAQRKKRDEIMPLLSMNKVSPTGDTPKAVPPTSDTVPPTGGTNVPPTGDHISNIVISKSNKEKHQFIFNVWNDKNIVKHKKITSGMERKINSLLKDLEVDEIVQAINVYAEVYHSPATFWSHKWTLEEFISRDKGARVFVHKTVGDYASNNNTHVGVM